MRFVAEDGQVYPLPVGEGSLIIGRHPSCHLAIDSPRVSKRHVECRIRGGQITVVDLESRNGTFVNGVRVTDRTLQHGDVLFLGELKLTYDAEPEGVAAAPPLPGMMPTGAAPPPPGVMPTEAAPPPLEPLAAEALSPDEADDVTPVDETFMPQPYQPQAQLPVAGQPQLVVRGQKWFLVDPNSNREIEIVPKTALSDEELSQYYTGREGQKKRTNHLIMAGVGGLVLVILLAILWPTSPLPPIRRARYDRRLYLKTLDAALEKFNIKNYSLAAEDFLKAKKLRGGRSGGFAERAADLARLWQHGQQSGFLDFEWRLARGNIDVIRELLDHDPTSKYYQWVEQLDEWIRRFQTDFEAIQSASEEAEVKNWPKAWQRIKRLKNAARVFKDFPQHKELRDRIETQYGYELLRKTADYVRRRQWNEAENVLVDLEEFGSLRDRVVRLRGICRVGKKEETVLRRARLHLNAGRYSQVLRTLGGIRQFYISERDELRGQALKRQADVAQLREQEKMRAQVRSLYDAGQVEALAKYLHDNADKGLAKGYGHLISKFGEMKKALGEIERKRRAAHATFNLDSLEIFEQLKGELRGVAESATRPFTCGFIRRKAQAALANLESAKFKDGLAKECMKLGDGQEELLRYRQARRYYEEARRLSGGTFGAEKLDTYRRKADRLWPKVLEDRYKGRAEDAKQKLRTILDLIPRDRSNTLYKKAYRALEEIKAGVVSPIRVAPGT